MTLTRLSAMGWLLGGCVKLAPVCEAVGQGYADDDRDGFGAGAEITACAEGLVDNADDCDDGAADVYPGAAEIWYDGTVGDRQHEPGSRTHTRSRYTRPPRSHKPARPVVGHLPA